MPLIVISAMAVETSVLQSHSAPPPAALGGHGLPPVEPHPRPSSRASATPGPTSSLLPVRSGTPNPGLRLVATQSSSSPQLSPTPPARRSTPPQPAPSPAPTVTVTGSPQPSPGPVPTCIVKLLGVGVCFGGN
jgi:hypothetical protein